MSLYPTCARFNHRPTDIKSAVAKKMKGVACLEQNHRSTDIKSAVAREGENAPMERSPYVSQDLAKGLPSFYSYKLCVTRFMSPDSSPDSHPIHDSALWISTCPSPLHAIRSPYDKSSSVGLAPFSGLSWERRAPARLFLFSGRSARCQAGAWRSQDRASNSSYRGVALSLLCWGGSVLRFGHPPQILRQFDAGHFGDFLERGEAADEAR
jgi:hypothetical protein